MKVELHCHTARYSGCAVATPRDLMKALVHAGYGAVYITEHDTLWMPEELADLRQEFPAIRIFPGVELSFTSPMAEHLVVLGAADSSYLGHRDPAEAILHARQDGHLTILAHPFRWAGGDKVLGGEVLPDAIECRTCNQDLAAAEIARATAGRLGLPIVNAGDVHAIEMTNRFWIETDRPIEQADDIRAIVMSGAYTSELRETNDGLHE